MPLRPSEIGCVHVTTPWVHRAVRAIDEQIAQTRWPEFDEEPLGDCLEFLLPGEPAVLTRPNKRDLSNLYLMAGWKGVEIFRINDTHICVRLNRKRPDEDWSTRSDLQDEPLVG